MTVQQQQLLALTYYHLAPCAVCAVGPHTETDPRDWCDQWRIRVALGGVPTWMLPGIDDGLKRPDGPLPEPPITEQQFLPAPNGRTLFNQLTEYVADHMPPVTIREKAAQDLLLVLSVACGQLYPPPLAPGQAPGNFGPPQIISADPNKNRTL